MARYELRLFMGNGCGSALLVAKYELRLFLGNGCGSALLGEVAVIEAADAAAAMSEAGRRVRELPRRCSGALYDPAGAQIWAEDAPDRKRR